MTLSHGCSASEDILDFFEFSAVDASVAVEVEHLKRHLEVSRRRGQHRQQEQIICPKNEEMP